MGVNFLVANPAKRQYIDPGCFGENEKVSGFMQGHHATAVAMLVCRAWDPGTIEAGNLMGTWGGDLIWLARDIDPADQRGVKTSTPGSPERNLYTMAWQEFQDISYRAIATLCDVLGDDSAEENAEVSVAESLARRAREHADVYADNEYLKTLLPWHLGNAVRYERTGRLNRTLGRYFGPSWQELWKRAGELHGKDS